MNSVITEVTDKKGEMVFYDAECAFCTVWAHRAERILKGRGFVFRPLSAPAEEMQVVTAAGETLGGAAALVHLARQVWWTWPLWAISRVPGTMRLLTREYRWAARRRNCTSCAAANRRLCTLTRRWSC
ncbi:MAG: thiol-disulfide oxidoreductase DCC family protein [Bryobacteraceae bacterium]